MMWGYRWDMGWIWLLGPLALIVIVLLVLLVVRAFGGSGPATGGGSGPVAGRSRARQILDERFARGELTTEQYREQIRELGEDRGP